MILRYLYSSCMRAFAPSFKTKYSDLLEGLPLGKFEKDVIRNRYIDVVVAAEDDYRRTCIMYIILTNLITIAGVLITGLVSLDKLSNISTGNATALFWVVWGLSIALTLSNKWLYSFNIHKKYVLNIATLEKFYSEGWSFMSGIGRYGKCPNMDDRYKLFCARVEKIRMKSLENLPEMENADAAAEILAASPGHAQITVNHPAPGEPADAVTISDMTPDDGGTGGVEITARTDQPRPSNSANQAVLDEHRPNSDAIRPADPPRTLADAQTDL